MYNTQTQFSQAYKIISGNINARQDDIFALCNAECDMKNLLWNNRETKWTIPTHTAGGYPIKQNHLNYKTI